MRQAGRLCAVSLAFQSQPFGDDDKSEAVGKVATTRDIYRVYATPGKAYDDIQDDGAKAGFWKAVKTSAWDRAAKILNRDGSQLKGILIDSFDGGAQHRQLRNNQGRIPSSQKPVMIVKDAQKLLRCDRNGKGRRRERRLGDMRPHPWRHSGNPAMDREAQFTGTSHRELWRGCDEHHAH